MYRVDPDTPIEDTVGAMSVGRTTAGRETVGTNKYTDWLPSLNLVYEPIDDLLVRGSICPEMIQVLEAAIEVGGNIVPEIMIPLIATRRELELLRALVDRECPTWAALPLTPLPRSGSSNALFRLGDGLLVRLGHAPLLAVSQQTWSWFANLLDYGVVAGFFMAEYLYRKLRFPGRHPSFLDFMRRMTTATDVLLDRALRETRTRAATMPTTSGATSTPTTGTSA